MIHVQKQGTQGSVCTGPLRDAFALATSARRRYDSQTVLLRHPLLRSKVRSQLSFHATTVKFAG